MTELMLRRVIAAPPARLFEAWTQPDLLRQWFGPAGVRCIGAEVDLRPGGAYRIGNALPGGEIVWIEGEFELVDSPHRLVYSWRVGDERPSRVTVSFTAVDDNATEVVVLHQQIDTNERRDGHERGWHGCLDGLERWATIAR